MVMIKTFIDHIGNIKHFFMQLITNIGTFMNKNTGIQNDCCFQIIVNRVGLNNSIYPCCHFSQSNQMIQLKDI